MKPKSYEPAECFVLSVETNFYWMKGGEKSNEILKLAGHLRALWYKLALKTGSSSSSAALYLY